MSGGKNDTVSARIEEELGEEYRRICNEEGVEYSEPIREFVNTFVENDDFSNFFLDYLNSETGFVDLAVEYTEQEWSKEALSEGFAYLNSGFNNRHKGIAEQSVPYFERVDEELGKGIEDVINGMDSNYWEFE